jgi:hypothetical protein
MALARRRAGACAQPRRIRASRSASSSASRPAGAADTVARAMSDAFGKALGQPVVVDNKPGNGSSIAADIVAKSAPDGYTLLIASPSSISVNPALNPKLTYTPPTSPVTKMTTSPLVLAVNPGDRNPLGARADRRGEEGPGQAQLLTSGNGRRRISARRSSACLPTRR